MINLKELFDNPVDYEVINSSGYEKNYKFIIDDKEYLFNSFEMNLLEYDYYHFFEENNDTFVQKVGKELEDFSEAFSIEINFSMRGLGYSQYGITDTGNQFTVFATVLKIMQDIIDKNKHVFLLFSGKEDSRVKLYDLFVKKVDRFLPGYEFIMRALTSYKDTAFMVGNIKLMEKYSND